MPENEFGQPVGPPLGSWTPPTGPPVGAMIGRHVLVRPWTRDDAAALHEAFGRSGDSLWTYMNWGPFETARELAQTLDSFGSDLRAAVHTIIVGDVPEGIASYLRIAPRDGSIEIGGITFSDRLQRTAAATEAMSLMIGAAFDAGFRRVEWKCDDLNAPSRRAAERLGFRFEGVFRKATQYKGRSRDTAWFAITDDDWPTIRAAHDAWLDPANFGADGRQLAPLRAVRA